MAIRVDPIKCPQNHACPLVAICPMEAISQAGDALPQIDPELCIECGLCVDKCPMQAVRFAED